MRCIEIRLLMITIGLQCSKLLTARWYVPCVQDKNSYLRVLSLNNSWGDYCQTSCIVALGILQDSCSGATPPLMWGRGNNLINVETRLSYNFIPLAVSFRLYQDNNKKMKTVLCRYYGNQIIHLLETSIRNIKKYIFICFLFGDNFIIFIFYGQLLQVAGRQGWWTDSK